MGDIKIKLGGSKYLIPNLGQDLNEKILNLFNAHLTGSAVDLSNFGMTVDTYLDANKDNWTAHDQYFNAFTPLWQHYISHNNFSAAESVWNEALVPAYNWEAKTNKRIHKGTPYYFWAVTVLLNRDIDKGFLLMHRGLQEDVLTTGNETPDTPGNAFVTLDYEKQKQFFRSRVQEIADFLEIYLTPYRTDRGKKLTLQSFRKRFLSDKALRPSAFYFVYLIHKLHNYQEHIVYDVANSDFAGLMELDFLFGYCLVIDKIIKQKCSDRQYIDLAVHLSKAASLTLDKKALATINGEFEKDFSNAIKATLAGNVGGLKLGESEIDLAISYGIRNRGAHNIEINESIYQNFMEISQRLLNTVFLATETLL